jgi:hypothetical protein
LLQKNVKIKIYRTITLPVVLYGCETWFPTLRKEHRLMVFDNSVLRKIFRPKRENLTGNGRKFYKEELHNLDSSTDIWAIKSTRMRWVGQWHV